MLKELLKNVLQEEVILSQDSLSKEKGKNKYKLKNNQYKLIIITELQYRKKQILILSRVNMYHGLYIVCSGLMYCLT